MTESKHVLTSKIFLTGLVTVLSGIAMMVADHYGVKLEVSLTMQGGIVTVLGGLVAYWRNRPTKKLHVKKPCLQVYESPVNENLWQTNSVIDINHALEELSDEEIKALEDMRGESLYCRGVRRKLGGDTSE